MNQNKARILSTGSLDPSLPEQAAREGIAINEMPFISTEAMDNAETRILIGQLALERLVVVFTSVHGVESVAGHLRKDQPGTAIDPARLPWKIFCIGSATRRSVCEQFGEQSIAGIADSAGELADRIIQQSFRQSNTKEGKTNGIVFFCGDQRRDDLPIKLSKEDIHVREIVVYKTVETPHVVKDIYDGIVFFSPSAVNSFFSVNTLSAAVVLFSIGDTTATAIRERCGNRVIVADSPGKEALIREAIQYFKTERSNAQT
jgi:uroporphyrinogen-III synthase